MNKFLSLFSEGILCNRKVIYIVSSLKINHEFCLLKLLIFRDVWFQMWKTIIVFPRLLTEFLIQFS